MNIMRKKGYFSKDFWKIKEWKLLKKKILKDVINCSWERCNYQLCFWKEPHHIHQIKLPPFPGDKPETCLLCNGIQPSALMNQIQIVTLLLSKSRIISKQFRSSSQLYRPFPGDKYREKCPEFTQIRWQGKKRGRIPAGWHQSDQLMAFTHF